MSDITDRLARIKARVTRAKYEIPRLVQPERSFVQDTADLDALVSALEVAVEALKFHHTIWSDGDVCLSECALTCDALAKIEQLLGEGG